MILGDLLINDEDGRPPLPVMKAMTIIAEHLHSTFDMYYEDGVSRDSCILVSAVLRDFLFRVGFHDAEVRSVSFYIERRKGDEIVHNLMIGRPGDPDKNGRWNGHMVVFMPKTGWLLDCTLYQAQRGQWEQLPGMVATPIRTSITSDGRTIISGFGTIVDDEAIVAAWIDVPENTRWRTAPDLLKGGKRERSRRAVADVLVYQFQRTGDEILT
jgi:hypothetical protein